MSDWTEMDDETFFNQKSDLKIILLGDSAVGKSK
jgi:GTPase SAR1 family protein